MKFKEYVDNLNKLSDRPCLKFKEYVDNLNKLLSDRPETAQFDVVISKDDEGNGYNLVCYSPSVGNYDSKEKENSSGRISNAVCVN